jgi:hypothetical protein
MPERHRWGPPDRRLHETVRTCLKCGLVKLSRHEGNLHWIEWYRVEERVELMRTPACVPVEHEAVPA